MKSPSISSLFAGIFFLLSASANHGQAAEPTAVEFVAADGVGITGDLYLANEAKDTPFLLLLHQAGSSRGEYREIAPKLVAYGFNCLAIDQRSGETQKGVDNETVKRASAAGKRTNFPDAVPDILAAAKYIRIQQSTGPIISWGSSYSASLALVMAGDYPTGFAGVLAFSPGEYFEKFGKSPMWVQQTAKKIQVPVFITSAQHEQAQWQPIFDAIPDSVEKSSYLPRTSGKHGSKALWEEFDDHQGYWDAVERFLKPWSPTLAAKLGDSGASDQPPAKPVETVHYAKLGQKERVGTMTLYSDNFWFDVAPDGNHRLIENPDRPRDEWSIYLYDNDRQLNLRLDYHSKRILLDTGAEEDKPLYSIIEVVKD